MASRISHPCDTVAQRPRFFRALVRVMLCLCLWSGPTPVLHAHHKSGHALENNPTLAQHVLACHSHDDGEYCQHWHMHFMLWGPMQPDSRDTDTAPPPPPVRDMQAEFAIALNPSGIHSELARAEAQLWSFDLVGLAAEFAPPTLKEIALNRSPLNTYQYQVVASHDAARFLMVVRC